MEFTRLESLVIGSLAESLGNPFVSLCRPIIEPPSLDHLTHQLKK